MIGGNRTARLGVCLVVIPGEVAMRSTRSVMGGVFVAALAVVLLAGAASALEVGQPAPDFTLPSAEGKPVKLSDLTAKGPVVLYTFIQAFTGP